jgi:hypothetical protein
MTTIGRFLLPILVKGDPAWQERGIENLPAPHGFVTFVDGVAAFLFTPDQARQMALALFAGAERAETAS